jgi:hypothetical protein
VVVAWLVFSVLKKVLGLIVLAGLALGAFVLWNNPDLRAMALGLVAGVFGGG